MSMKQVTADSTPLMVKTASYGGDEVRLVTDALIERELRGASLLDVDGLIQHIFPYDSLPFDLDDVFDRIKQSGNLYLDGQWIHAGESSDSDSDTSGNEEQSSEARAAEFFNSVIQEIEVASGISTEWRWSGAWASTPLPPTKPCQRKPDLVLKHKDLQEEQATWEDPRSAGELKANAKPENVKDAERGLAEDARLIFGHQPNRRYVVGLVLAGDELEMCLYDRCGVIGETSFNINLCPKRFLWVLGSIVFGDDTALGYDPTINLKSDPPTIMVKGKSYEILEVVHIGAVIRGRGTVCFRVTRGGEKFIIKDSWADTSRLFNEAALLKEAGDVPGLARWFEDEELDIGGKSDTTGARRSILEGLADYPYAQDYEKLEIRIHRRIVLKDCGTPIQNFASRRELVGGLIDVILAHRALHDEKKIIHRDISLRNIMLQDNGSPPGKRPGLLIDLDYSVKIDRLFTADTTNHRTGTLPYMAIDILTAKQSVEHKAYHDLESFFYVLCWICTVMAGPGLPRRFELEESELRQWFQYIKFNTVGLHKDNSLRDDASFNALLSEFHPYFDAIRPCARQLRDLFLSQTIKKNPASSAPVYDSVLDVLRHTRDALPEEEPRSVLEIKDPWPQIKANKRKATQEKKPARPPRRSQRQDVDTSPLKLAMKRRRDMQQVEARGEGSQTKKSRQESS
ncbi:hypothetical protein EWM64_g6495 [Hericium alpestre]|uniref:Protein kinase domain-containing protein n=1 Tax=Hericium alpestre TaxID=135208 RepID=A0A4Y9ZTZ0_9AGAM|nr:hypothetical protein EWM64_g6495 [Hericium alpestre]